MSRTKQFEIKNDSDISKDGKIRKHRRSQKLEDAKNNLMVVGMYVVPIFLALLFIVVSGHALLMGDYGLLQRYLEWGLSAVLGYFFNELMNKKV